MMEVAQENLGKAQTKHKVWYDRNARVRELVEGSQVLVLLPTSSNRLRTEWQGPFKVIRKVSPVNYEIEMGNKRRRRNILHIIL